MKSQKRHTGHFKCDSGGMEQDLKSKDEVLLWMIDNQITRRNLSSGNKIILAQRKAPILEKLAKANLKLASGGDRKSENYKNQGLSEVTKVDCKKPETTQPQKIEYSKPKTR